MVFQIGGDPVYGRWFDSEKCYVFGAPNSGSFQFALAAVGIVGGKAAIDIAQHTVQVGDAPPPGPPGPDPGPRPAPLPPGRFNLASQSRDWAALVQLAASDRVRTAQRSPAVSTRWPAKSPPAGWQPLPMPSRKRRRATKPPSALRRPPGHPGQRNGRRH